MKITPDEVSELVENMINLNKRLSIDYVKTIEDQENKIQGLNAVVITLKDFRDKAISQGYKPTQESGA